MFDNKYFIYHIICQNILYQAYVEQLKKQKTQTFMQRQNTIKIIDRQITMSKLYNQLSIVRKVIHAIVWVSKNKFDKQIIYEITKFLFKNPLVIIVPIYKKAGFSKLKIEEKKSYILMNIERERQQEVKRQKETEFINQKSEKIKLFNKQSNCSQKTWHFEDEIRLIKTGFYSIHIKVHRCWKNSKINYANSSFKQILIKSRHFMDFLKNVKIDNPKNIVVENQRSYEGQNLQEKQNKLYTLICENYDYILSKINQIQDNEKHKRLDDVIAKTYVEMMNKNIIILSVEKNNFNSVSYKSQGKFIYVSNHLKLPLLSQKFDRIYGNLETFKVEKYLIDLIPYLETNFQGQWFIKNRIPKSLELFQQKGKQIDRGKGLIIDRQLNFFQYDDFFIKEV